MLIRKRYEERNLSCLCPACNARVGNVHYICYQNDKKHKIFRCRACGFMFARPVFLQKLEDRQLDYVYDAELLNNAFLRKLHKKLIVGKEISYVRKILGEGTFSLLDIGCGTGWTTSMWINSGFKVTGLEPSKGRGKLASEKYDIKIISDYLENLSITETFDVVILRHLVEHFADPYEMIVKVHSLLTSQGVVIIVVPNINCIGRYIFGTKWTWGIPYHCNFFNPKTLCQLIHRAGFDILKTYQTPSPLSYPESFLRLLPRSEWLTAKVYNKLHSFSLLPVAPLVILGYLTRLSENITVIARVKRRSEGRD